MHFATAIDSNETAVVLQLDLRGIESPLRGALRFRQLGDEPVEDHMPVADAGIGVTQGGVECCRVARIAHAYDARTVTMGIVAVVGIRSGLRPTA